MFEQYTSLNGTNDAKLQHTQALSQINLLKIICQTDTHYKTATDSCPSFCRAIRIPYVNTKTTALTFKTHEV